MNSIESINKEKTFFTSADINYDSIGIIHKDLLDLYITDSSIT